MTDTIHLTVATVVHRDGRFLMVRERDGGIEVINQPAGHVEAGESLQSAALRETLEETGWRVKLTGFLGMGTYLSPRNGRTYYRVSFCAVPVERAADAPLDPDIIDAHWWDLDTLKQQEHLLRSPMVRDDVETFLAGAVYPLELIRDFGH